MPKNKVRIEEVENGYIVTSTVDDRLVSRFIESDARSAGDRVTDILVSFQEGHRGRAQEPSR